MPIFLAHDSRHAWSEAVLHGQALTSPGYGESQTVYLKVALSSRQQHFIGPVLTGQRNFAPYGKLKYEVGYLFGLSVASPRSALRWKFEYAISF